MSKSELVYMVAYFLTGVVVAITIFRIHRINGGLRYMTFWLMTVSVICPLPVLIFLCDYIVDFEYRYRLGQKEIVEEYADHD